MADFRPFRDEDLTKDGVYGVGIPGTNGTLDLQIFMGIAYRNGGRWVEDGQVVLNGPGVVYALSFYKDLLPYAAPGLTATTGFSPLMPYFSKSSAVLRSDFASTNSSVLRDGISRPISSHRWR